jgi:hypothetical protein
MRLPADPVNSEVRLRYEEIARDWEYALHAEDRGLPAPVLNVAWKQVADRAIDLLDDLLFDRPVRPIE